MVNRIRTGGPRGFNKGCSLKFHVGSEVQQTPEKGHIDWNIAEITIKMKAIVQKPLMIKKFELIL